MYGTRNSTCSLKLPSNSCLLMMLSPCASITPLSSSLNPGLPLPSSLVQLSRLLPSKRTMAPSGGGIDFTSTLSSGLATARSLISPYWAGAKPAQTSSARQVYKQHDIRSMAGTSRRDGPAEATICAAAAVCQGLQAKELWLSRGQVLCLSVTSTVTNSLDYPPYGRQGQMCQI